MRNPRASAPGLGGPNAVSRRCPQASLPCLPPSPTTPLCSSWQRVPRSPRSSDTQRKRSGLSGPPCPLGGVRPLAAAFPHQSFRFVQRLRLFKQNGTPNEQGTPAIAGRLTTKEERAT